MLPWIDIDSTKVWNFIVHFQIEIDLTFCFQRYNLFIFRTETFLFCCLQKFSIGRADFTRKNIAIVPFKLPWHQQLSYIWPNSLFKHSTMTSRAIIKIANQYIFVKDKVNYINYFLLCLVQIVASRDWHDRCQATIIHINSFRSCPGRSFSG